MERRLLPHFRPQKNFICFIFCLYGPVGWNIVAGRQLPESDAIDLPRLSLSTSRHPKKQNRGRQRIFCDRLLDVFVFVLRFCAG